MKGISSNPPFFVSITIVLLLISLVSFLPSSKSNPSTVMSIQPSYVLVKAQNNFTVSIVLTESPLFISFEAALNFNKTLLEALNGNVTVPWEGCQFLIDNSEGTVYIYGFDGSNPLEGNQTLATVEFRALAHSNSTLNLTDTYISGTDHNPIAHTTETALVEVIGPLDLTVASARHHYYVGTNIEIHGNTMIEDATVETLIGLELVTPKNTSIVRTLTSGAAPPQESWRINVTDFYPSDQQGNHANSFSNGTQAYFTIQIQNMADEPLPYLIYISVLDTYNGSVGQLVSQGTIQPGSPSLLISAVYLPYDVYNGSAEAYASVLSDWPRSGGIPYCPEQSVNFMITGGLTTTPTPVPYGNVTFESDYAGTFNLSSDYSFGNYSVYASAEYKTQTAAARTTFFNTILADFNCDGRVGSVDLNCLLIAYGSDPQKPYWFPEADFNLDGRIGPQDLNALLIRFGQHI